MAYWLVLVTLIAVGAGGYLCLALVRHRRTRARQTRLRLLSGRQRLLSDEVEQRRQALMASDPEASRRIRRDALAALDQLHIGAVERQTYLLIYEELAHLLDYKLHALAADAVGTSPHPSTASSPPPRRKMPPEHPHPSSASVPPDRAQLEAELRTKINQLRNPSHD